MSYEEIPSSAEATRVLCLSLVDRLVNPREGYVPQELCTLVEAAVVGQNSLALLHAKASLQVWDDVLKLEIPF